MAQSPGYRPPTLGVQGPVPSIAAPRLHQPHNTEDKNPKTNGETTLNAKDNLERDLYNYTEKRKIKKMKTGVKKNRETKPIIKSLSEK